MKDRNGKTIHVGHVVNIHDKTTGILLAECSDYDMLGNSGVVESIDGADSAGGVIVISAFNSESDSLMGLYFAPTDLEVICKL